MPKAWRIVISAATLIIGLGGIIWLIEDQPVGMSNAYVSIKWALGYVLLILACCGYGFLGETIKPEWFLSDLERARRFMEADDDSDPEL